MFVLTYQVRLETKTLVIDSVSRKGSGETDQAHLGHCWLPLQGKISFLGLKFQIKLHNGKLLIFNLSIQCDSLPTFNMVKH